MKHPSFTTLVQFPSANTRASENVPIDHESDHEEEDEFAEIERRKKKEQTAEMEERIFNMRETAFAVYRECSNIICLMVIDYPDAAVVTVADPENRAHLMVIIIW